MRSLILAAVAAVLTAAVMAPPAQAAEPRHHQHAQSIYGAPGAVYRQAPYGSYTGGVNEDSQIQLEERRDPPDDR